MLWVGTVGLALCWLVAIGIMMHVAWKALTQPDHQSPHDVADALGKLADAERQPFKGKVPSLTEQERLAYKRRLYLISDRARGRARITAFSQPKDVA